MHVELNVGLNLSPRFEFIQSPLDMSRVVRVLADLGFFAVRVELLKAFDADSEDTIYLRANFYNGEKDLVRALLLAASCLGQDCISVRFRTGLGGLVGAFASEWGGWQGKFFRCPEHPNGNADV